MTVALTAGGDSAVCSVVVVTGAFTLRVLRRFVAGGCSGAGVVTMSTSDWSSSADFSEISRRRWNNFRICVLPLIFVIFRMVLSPPLALLVAGVDGRSDSASERSGLVVTTREERGEVSTCAGAGIDFRRLLRGAEIGSASRWRLRAL